HNAICPVKNSVCNVGGFSSCRTRRYCHGFKHLCCCDHWFPKSISHLDHCFLSKKHLFDRNLHPKISSSHHESIRVRQNLLKVHHSFLILHL
ncbi:hypothetical protein CARUB_v10018317mg, partial [Capsella rubella]